MDQDQVDFTTSRTRLLILGMRPEEYLVREKEKEGTEGRYLIRAPRDGVIVSRDVTEGEFVDSKMTLFDLQDLETVWVQASAYEQDLAKVAVGSQARVFLNALPANPFHGKVDFIDYHVDPDTRSAAVRIVVKNDPLEEWKEPFPIRPGMFGRVEILTGSRKVAVLIPESALVHEGDRESVFVRLEPGRFEKRIVRISPGSGGVVEVREGLDPGEDVVVQGTFALKSFARKGEIGEGD
ncbi:MAG: efflux RND transporter periplasmic adaptor subunit [Planctomycetota bacterium]